VRELPASIIIEKNKVATPNAWLILLKITLTDTANTELRFVRNTEDIEFNDNIDDSHSENQTYTAFPFEIEPTKNMSKGQIPTVTLRVSNITNLLETYLESLDGAIGSTVKITVVNSGRLAENYSELELTYDVIACNSTSQWVTFILGSPNPLRQRFPLHKYMALHCRFQYRDVEDQIGPRCQYVGKVITGITKAANAKVSVASHGFAVDDVIKFATVLGMIEINGKSGTVVDADPDADGDAFTVDIDSGAFSDYISGGRCGYATCKKTLAECRERNNSVNFGGFPGIRSGTIRIA